MKKSISVLEHIDGQRYRESHGMYYEDFDVGDIYEHRPGRTISEADNTWMSLLCMNTHPLHIDAAYGEQTEFKKPLVSSLITFAIIGGLSLASTSARGVANLGWSNVRFLSPVFAGDTIYAETRVVAKRQSDSRPGDGIVTVETKGFVHPDRQFMVCERSFLVPLRNAQQ
ncbi:MULTISPECIES: MaoC family dehydratase [Telluria group]|uniref:Itaconyl-CoA hydratase n=1 Tax=Pseudoduganella violacea TaxID=1715466 RepID=A0A7W5B661_9BURK|nr:MULTISPECIES: MaoC family dehydratase [Telluria group]AKU23106.1 dehydratase [Massilia sp. NR 4-1]MBB3117108.1 itaconyl-CoA hydratase [Pseudoduganella violacea]UMR32009.1 MaoC family dehydratase [Massilia sp. MB5]UTY56987.1 MaoC family dehydratase [Massilia sp. erpn]